MLYCCYIILYGIILYILLEDQHFDVVRWMWWYLQQVKSTLNFKGRHKTFSSNQIHNVPFHWVLLLTYVCEEFVVKMATAITLLSLFSLLSWMTLWIAFSVLPGDTENATPDCGCQHVQEFLHHSGNVLTAPLLCFCWSGFIWYSEIRREH